MYNDIRQAIIDIVSIAKEAKNHELNNKILDIQIKTMELINEIEELKSINADLFNKINEKGDLEIHGGIYERKSDGRKFCAKCYDDQSKLISVFETDLGYWCSKCKHGYPGN